MRRYEDLTPEEKEKRNKESREKFYDPEWWTDTTSLSKGKPNKLVLDHIAYLRKELAKDGIHLPTPEERKAMFAGK